MTAQGTSPGGGLPALAARLRELQSAATPGPYRAHDHNDMAKLGEDPEKWMGYAWVGRITPQSEPDGRFDAGWLDRDSRDDGSKPYRERASADVHFVAEALNALPALLHAVNSQAALREALGSLVKAGERVNAYSLSVPGEPSWGIEQDRRESARKWLADPTNWLAAARAALAQSEAE